jgi:hypothetical protein
MALLETVMPRAQHRAFFGNETLTHRASFAH